MGGGDLQTTFDDLHDRDEFTLFLQDELLLLLPNFLLLLGQTIPRHTILILTSDSTVSEHNTGRS